MTAVDRTAIGPSKFIAAWAKKLLVEWCEEAIESEDGKPTIPPGPYRDHALAKSWISRKDGTILAKGWEVAASYLK